MPMAIGLLRKRFRPNKSLLHKSMILLYIYLIGGSFSYNCTHSLRNLNPVLNYTTFSVGLPYILVHKPSHGLIVPHIFSHNIMKNVLSVNKVISQIFICFNFHIWLIWGWCIFHNILVKNVRGSADLQMGLCTNLYRIYGYF